MDNSPLLPPPPLKDLLVWHQGALGDLLLAGPALTAISRHYAGAQITAVGHPERWGLLSLSLPLAGIWDSSEVRWAHLFSEAPLPAELQKLLANFSLALIFSPNPHPLLLRRLTEAGIPAVHRLPSFPQAGCEPVAAVQARRLAELGLVYRPGPFRLTIDPDWAAGLPSLAATRPWLAVAPGSSHLCKNWPLSHFYEVSRGLAWEQKMGVVWLAGPAEIARVPYLRALAAAQGHLLLAGCPLRQVAAALARSRLYLGNDSGLTHLAAAVGGPGVIAIFGPTDPRAWAPPGKQVKILTGPCPQTPCARGREIACPDPRCLTNLAPAEVMAAAAGLLAGSRMGTAAGKF